MKEKEIEVDIDIDIDTTDVTMIPDSDSEKIKEIDKALKKIKVHKPKPKPKPKAKTVSEYSLKDLRKGEVVVSQPGTNLFKAKRGYMNLGLFHSEALAVKIVVESRIE